MGAIIIRTGQGNTKLLHELAKKLGADVMKLKDEEFEELMLGRLKDKTKTKTGNWLQGKPFLKS